MAYFETIEQSQVLLNQCKICRYGKKFCPIAGIQFAFNGDTFGNKVATAILDSIVKKDGTCSMFYAFRRDFEVKPKEERQLEFDFKGE
jgi:hypothetical protein